MTRAADRTRFASALRQHLKLRGLTQEAVARRLGVGQSAVSGWLTAKSAPGPERTFALEKLLQLSPGTLAALLSYRAPEEHQHRCDVVKAIDENHLLSRAHKDLLLTMYATLIELDAGQIR